MVVRSGQDSELPSDEIGLAGQLNAFLKQAVPRIHDLGIRVVELSEGYVLSEAPLATNGNHLGTMYAGTLFGLAEMLGGALVRPSFDFADFYPTVKDLQIRFLRPATSDVQGTASLDEATITKLRTDLAKHGKAEFVVDAVLTDSSDKVVATSRGTYQVRPRGPVL